MGPFLDTAGPIVESALHIGCCYLDVTAEQASAKAMFEAYDQPAHAAGITVIPAASFYGGLADLLASAPVADGHVNRIMQQKERAQRLAGPFPRYRNAPENGLDEARERAMAYAKAGASGFFVPGLVDLHVIAELCDIIDLPLNVMVMPGLPDTRALSDAGVAHISYGPAPYLQAMEAVRHAAQRVLA